MHIPGRVFVDEKVAMVANMHCGDVCIVMKRNNDYKYVYPISHINNMYQNIKTNAHRGFRTAELLGFQMVGYHTQTESYSSE